MNDTMKFKPDTELDAARDDAYRAGADELRQFIERIERLETEKKGIADQVKEVFAESKARGYDQKALREIIRIRKRDSDEVAEQEAVVAMYREALGI
jgi:uncharacterized protein (UPF0335 family)